MYNSDLSVMLQWANVFISVFIIIIAYFFFQKTKPHKNRTPWIILFIAVIMFFIFELSSAIFPNLNPIPELKDFFKTLFVGFVLYVFVYEHYLIQHSDIIVIEKKEEKSTPSNKPQEETVKTSSLKSKKNKKN